MIWEKFASLITGTTSLFFPLCSDKHNHTDWFLNPRRVMHQSLVEIDKKFDSLFFLVQIRNKWKSRAFGSHSTEITSLWQLLETGDDNKHNAFLLKLFIGNPLLTSKVNVIINVLDVNEFPPEISVPYETSVCENAKPGQVFQVCNACCFAFSFLIIYSSRNFWV